MYSLAWLNVQIYLPIAEMSVPADSIFLLGAIVGFLSGVFGVGGGFLTTPFLIFFGIPPAIAVGTPSNQLVATGMAGTIGHLRRNNVDMKMGSVMLVGGVIGTSVGIAIFRFLRELGQIDLAISLLYIVLLGSIGSMMLFEAFFSSMRKKTVRREFNTMKVSGWVHALPMKMRFERSNLFISALMPAGVGFIGGVLSAILGIGGGFLLVPAMIYILGMPTLMAVGTSLFQITVITTISTIMHATFNNTVDVVLAVILIVGGVIGSQLGVVMGRSIKPLHARITMAALILIISIQLSTKLLFEPEDLFSSVTITGGL